MNRIERIYKALGHNRHSFSQIAGVADGTVKTWEKGELSSGTIKWLHDRFGVSYEYLLGQGKTTGSEKIDRIINLLEEVEQLRKEISG